MREIDAVIYESEDGQLFLTKDECKEHETYTKIRWQLTLQLWVSGIETNIDVVNKIIDNIIKDPKAITEILKPLLDGENKS